MKDEIDLNLFEDIKDKKVLDIGCGSGHSLEYMASKHAKELWGLDLSDSQINNAKRYLKQKGHKAHLFQSPMEVNPGIPTGHFDIVYSIYAFGWTVDLEHSIQLVSDYLKPGGMFVFSWDHPLMACTEMKLNDFVISKSYHETNQYKLMKADQELYITKWKLSSYSEALKKAGMYIDTIIEDVKDEILSKDYNDLDKYYSKDKAKKHPLSIIIKAIKK
jgi:2-polyprenyl-3-methyl-5-hydroxy-6-metoxy-1,4-benzoquinol methylase